MALPRSYRDGLTVRPSWFPDWSGDVVAIVAGGESVIPEAVDSLRGRCRVAVINNSYQLAPWADLLYAADGKWWEYHVAARGFSGLKVTPDAAAARRYGLNRVSLVPETAEECARIFLGGDGSIGHGGNGGFQTVNLVTAFGARRQIWIGLDFCGEHWHGKHPDALKNPRPQTLEKWRKRLDGQADELKRLGVEVLNVSSTSALTNYRKCSLPEALASRAPSRSMAA